MVEMSSYLDRIIDRFNHQTQKGIKKYGQILEDNPRTDPLIALEFMAEELTDGLMYLEELKEKLALAQRKTKLNKYHESGTRRDIPLPEVDWRSHDWTIPGQIKKVFEEAGEVAEAIALDDWENVVRESLDTMQTCWTLISMVQANYLVEINKIFREHTEKLERKGYL